MPNEKWNDRTLDMKFEVLETQDATVRDLPAHLAAVEVRVNNIAAALVDVAEDCRVTRRDLAEQGKTTGRIEVDLAKISTKVAMWAAIGTLAGGGIVTLAVAQIH